LIIRIIFCEYRSLSSSICIFLHFPVTSSLLDPNILLSTLFSNNLIPRSSLRLRGQVSHPYKTTRKIIVVNCNIRDNWSQRFQWQCGHSGTQTDPCE
jgi:hypothetical protein